MSNRFTIDSSSEFSIELSTTLAICSTIDTPRSLTVAMLIEGMEYQQLINLEINASDYDDAAKFADDYLVTSLLKKSPNLPLGIDREQAALDSFLESEVTCAQTNKRLAACMQHGIEPAYVARIRRIMARILGPINESVLSKIESNMSFGPGACVGVTGDGLILSDKFRKTPTMTESLMPFQAALLGDTWSACTGSINLVPGCTFFTVPKDAKTDRGACTEPLLNQFGQKGIGKHIRNRLRLFGINLNSQARNQFLASEAISRGLVTLDLSNASNNVAFMTIPYLLDYQWTHLLKLFRSPKYRVRTSSVYHPLAKWSTMGNGYTFELESLIFATVAFACVPEHEHHNISIYGDDIIVPRAHAHLVIDALTFLGFSVNHKKSFLEGNFFESCGTDWFKGQNVRPFFLRGASERDFNPETGESNARSPLPYVVQIANKLRLYARRRGFDGKTCDPRWRPVWLALFKSCPRSWRGYRVPESLGDTGILSARAEANVKPPKEKTWEGVRVLHSVENPQSVTKSDEARYVLALSMAGSTRIPTRGKEPRRGIFGLPVPKWVHVTWDPMVLEWADKAYSPIP